MTTALEVIDGLIGDFEDNQATPPETALENVRSALGRGLPEITGSYPASATTGWGHRLSIVGGGPSLAQTMDELSGCIAAVNGSVQHLLDHGITPHAVAVCDAVDYMHEIVPARPDIEYFIASRCHPNLFDHLAGCKVKLWHAYSLEDPTEILQERRKQDGNDFLVVGGGTTVSLRWVNLGYVLGFRCYACHGMDSSVRKWMHAYEDKNGTDRLGPYAAPFIVRGYPTSYVFARQVPQFIQIAETLMSGEHSDPCTFEVYGEGLLQHCWREYLQSKEEEAA